MISLFNPDTSDFKQSRQGPELQFLHMQPEENKKYSYLDNYKILKTLGQGYHAQVKLGMDDNGALYAIKRYKKDTANLETLMHELGIMKVLHHENLVRLVDVRENATYKRKDETTFKCFAIILEFVGGGELFDFIAETGKFSEKVARTYFHQMMNGLHYMHSKGYAHRDIKPENILLGRDFVLKLADFGFSSLIRGKDGSGVLHTKLGTEGYMAPEVPTKNYEGAKIDIFAAGVILFIMYAGNPPFEKATPNDPYYKLIKDKNFATFWKAHSRRRPVNYFPEDFKNLFERMVAYIPNERPTIMEIAQHPWVTKDVCSQNEIKTEFDVRLKQLDQILERRRQEQEALKNKHMEGINNMGGCRGGDEETAVFCEIFEGELSKERNLGALEPINPEDFVIDENASYAISLLKQFCKQKKIPLENEQQEESEFEPLFLRPTEAQQNQDGLTVTYEMTDDIDGEEFTESVNVSIKFGNTGSSKLAIQVRLEEGSSFYFKKIAVAVKNLYAYCKV